MAKVTLELEEQDARIIASALGLAVFTVTDPAELSFAVFNPPERKLINALLGLMAGIQQMKEFEAACRDESRVDALSVEMSHKTLQLNRLIKTIIHQTDPDVVPTL